LIIIAPKKYVAYIARAANRGKKSTTPKAVIPHAWLPEE
jgi:hypothetical protein